jgi:hypothetical protein
MAMAEGGSKRGLIDIAGRGWQGGGSKHMVLCQGRKKTMKKKDVVQEESILETMKNRKVKDVRLGVSALYLASKVLFRISSGRAQNRLRLMD